MVECNDDDWKKFYQPVNNQKSMIQRRKDEKFFFCLDDIDPKENKLKGTDYNSGGMRDFSIVFKPCKPQKRSEANKDSKCRTYNDTSELEKILEEQKDFVNEALFEIYHNQEMLDPNSFE